MKKKDKPAKRWQMSFAPLTRYMAVFCALILITELLCFGIIALGHMKSEAERALTVSSRQVSTRVGNAINLLEALADLPELYDPEVPPVEKVATLGLVSPHFDLMMICFVNDEIEVFSKDGTFASLASRDYMQRLFSTGRRQVTDSFAAGADGVTLNYTVAVPLLDEGGVITGCLFCAIYFDEVVDIMTETSQLSDTELILVGSKGQTMSSTAGAPYGEPALDNFREGILLGITTDELEEQLLAATPGDFWGITHGQLYYTTYKNVDNADWDMLVSLGFIPAFASLLPALLLTCGLTVVVFLLLILLSRRYIAGQMVTFDSLVASVQELEKQVYRDERPEGVDLREVLRLTSRGLSDSLTGVVTRSVFMSHAEDLLQKTTERPLRVLCFIDLDNLKFINENCGYEQGDIALKSMGYILREYEKKYDGLVGRYGGDEFVLLMTGLDDEEELRSVLDELVLRLHSEVVSGEDRFPLQCSVGVSLYEEGMTLERLIADADEALYFVKENGKGYYHIHRN